MTDEAVICTWMEPEAAKAVVIDKAATWKWHRLDWSNNTIHTRPLTLDALWEVEERLTDDQWWEYEVTLSAPYGPTVLAQVKAHVHSTAAQKIVALAAVLRPIVEAA